MHVKIWAKPADGHLDLLVRAPFTAINDIQFPEKQGGFLDFDAVQSILPGAAKYWIGDSIQIFENGQALPKPSLAAVRASLPSDKSFGAFDSAMALLRGAPVDPNEQIVPTQAYLDIFFQYPIHSETSDFAVQADLTKLAARVWVDLKFLPPGGVARDISWEGDPGLVRLNPTAMDAARQFFGWGFFHLLNGTDYLLFLFCLMLPFRRAVEAVALGCAFAVANTITLIASAAGQAPDDLWFRPLIETSIAVLILYIALENIAGILTLWRRLVMAAGAGLVFGFSFGFGLAAKAEYGATHPAVSAAAFNVGAEIALALVLAAMVPLVALLVRITPAKRMESIVLSALAAHTAWHWMTERWDRLSLFTFHLPAFDAGFLATAMRWMTVILVLAGLLWLLSGLFQAKFDQPPASDETSPGPVA